MSITDRIRSGEFTSIVICSGAGVSTGAGIPDYRSSGGIFQTLAEEYTEISEPKDILSRWFKDLHPEFEQSEKYMQWLTQIQEAQPTPAHQLATWLDERGWLKRVYTQNIDGLYLKAGLPKERLVEFHGNITKGVVLYGDDIPEKCIKTLKEDHEDILEREGCDLMLLMGTSLQVAPFCAIPNMVPRKCVRCYVDMTPSFQNEFSTTGIGMYASGPAPVVKFHRAVSLRPQWRSSPHATKRYKEEYIVEEDCSVFSSRIIDGH